eukprot:364485-Chlamydomonas_euryale.AAC.2
MRCAKCVTNTSRQMRHKYVAPKESQTHSAKGVTKPQTVSRIRQRLGASSILVDNQILRKKHKEQPNQPLAN